jgi:hypothetical protein
MFADPSHAGRVKLGAATVSGTGCPQPSSVNFTISPDDRALSVLFDQMYVEAGGATGVRESTKTCSFTIPIELPIGMSLSVAQVDYRGYVFAQKQNIFNHMSSDFYLDAKPLRHFEHKFPGPVADVFTLTQAVPVRERHKSNCAGKTTLSVATRILTRTNPQGDPSQIALDSQDITSRDGRIVYRLEQTPCQ